MPFIFLIAMKGASSSSTSLAGTEIIADNQILDDFDARITVESSASVDFANKSRTMWNDVVLTLFLAGISANLDAMSRYVMSTWEFPLFSVENGAVSGGDFSSWDLLCSVANLVIAA